MKRADILAQNTTLLPSGTGSLPAANHRLYNSYEVGEFYAVPVAETHGADGNFHRENTNITYGITSWKTGTTANVVIEFAGNGTTLFNTRLLSYVNDEFVPFADQPFTAASISGATVILEARTDGIYLSSGSILNTNTFVCKLTYSVNE